MTTPSEMRPGTWHVPECPWRIEYLPAALDEIRIAVVDAFFSLPRGGAEIGGLLFGTFRDNEVRIVTYRPMECEHAFGPTFVLSEKDLMQLEIQIAASPADPTLQGLEVVGWYHSHTRSEIFLSEADLAIYDRFFPKPWQVALVLRPSGMKPTRAGFFFRDRDGAVHSSKTYLEFIVGAQAEAVPTANGHPWDGRGSRSTPLMTPAGQPPDLAGQPPSQGFPPAADAGSPAPLAPAEAMLQWLENQPAQTVGDLPQPAESPFEFQHPAYQRPPEADRTRVRIWIVVALLAAAAGIAGYFTAGSWLKSLTAKSVNLHLQALELQGQLRIQWDRDELASQDVETGLLEIIDGQATTAIPLDSAKVRAGSLQYARRSEMVEVHLTVRTAGGKSFEEFTTFLGQPPPAVSSDDAERQKAAALAAEAERTRSELKKEEQRALELQRSLEQMKQLLRRQEDRKRVAAAAPAASPAPATGLPPASNPAPSGQAAQPPAAAPKSQPAPPDAERVRLPSPLDRPAPAETAQLPSPPAIQNSKPAAVHQPPAFPPANKPQPLQPPALPLPLSGKWVYSAGSASASPFPPEAVALNLTESGGRVRGVFSGRYRVPKNSKFTGRVTFSFEGASRPGNLRFAFAASDGLKGDIEIIRLPSRKDVIEVVWRSDRDKLTFDDLYFRVP